MEILDRIKASAISVNKVTLVAIIAVVLLIAWLLWPRSEPEQIGSLENQGVQVPDSNISVHVVGEVGNPGLYQLPLGSRVSDVIDLAGGVSENASSASINLARILIDGEQIVVKSGVEHQQEMDSKISINESDADQLDQLPGVGPSIAGKIIDYRERNGLFRSLEQLTEVSGIGPKMLENIRDLVRL